MMLSIDTELPYLAGDITQTPFVIQNGQIAVPEQPGLGVSVDLDLVERYRVGSVPQAYLDQRRPEWFPTKPAY
jgi:L-rhamnonate dehydratase